MTCKENENARAWIRAPAYKYPDSRSGDKHARTVPNERGTRPANQAAIIKPDAYPHGTQRPQYKYLAETNHAHCGTVQHSAAPQYRGTALRSATISRHSTAQRYNIAAQHSAALQ